MFKAIGAVIVIAPKRKILTASVLGAVVIGGLGIGSAGAASTSSFMVQATDGSNGEIQARVGFIDGASDGGTGEGESPAIQSPTEALQIAWDEELGSPDCEIVDGYCAPGTHNDWINNRGNVLLAGAPQQWTDGVQSGSMKVELRTSQNHIIGSLTRFIESDGSMLTKAEVAARYPGKNENEISSAVGSMLDNSTLKRDVQYFTAENPLRITSDSWSFGFDSSQSSLSVKPPIAVLEARSLEALERESGSDYAWLHPTENMNNDGYTNRFNAEIVVTDLRTQKQSVFPIEVSLIIAQ